MYYLDWAISLISLRKTDFGVCAPFKLCCCHGFPNFLKRTIKPSDRMIIHVWVEQYTKLLEVFVIESNVK